MRCTEATDDDDSDDEESEGSDESGSDKSVEHQKRSCYMYVEMLVVSCSLRSNKVPCHTDPRP